MQATDATTETDIDFLMQYLELLADIHLRTTTTARRELTQQDKHCIENARNFGIELQEAHTQNNIVASKQLQDSLDSIIDNEVQGLISSTPH